MYQKSWIDRPLGVAGRVVIKGKTVFTPQVLLYKSDRPLCIIPSLAIHMDKELNKKGALETAKELVPLAALSEEDQTPHFLIVKNYHHINRMVWYFPTIFYPMQNGTY